MDLELHQGEIWSFTNKAKRSKRFPKGLHDRLFFVCYMDEEGDLIAFKVDRNPEQAYTHPGYGKLTGTESLTADSKWFRINPKNTSKPTAWFKPDSFYKKLTIHEAKNILSNAAIEQQNQFNQIDNKPMNDSELVEMVQTLLILEDSTATPQDCYTFFNNLQERLSYAYNMLTDSGVIKDGSGLQEWTKDGRNKFITKLSDHFQNKILKK